MIRKSLLYNLCCTVYFFLFLSQSSLAKNCLNISVTQIIPLPEISGASGIEYIDGFYYITGDNSPFLFQLNDEFSIQKKIDIYDNSLAVNDTLPKKIKPDFEAMTPVNHASPFELYIFGSGSKSPVRDILKRVDLEDSKNSDSVSLVIFYEKLVAQTGDELNIEAALCTAHRLYLFNRANNKVYSILLNQFETFLSSGEFPDITVHSFVLPSVRGIHCGFSGACLIPETNTALFTASAENTTDWIADGDVLGSYIGVIDFSAEDPSSTIQFIEIPFKNYDTPSKVESVCIRQIKGQSAQICMVADNDDRGSELILAKLKF